MLMILQIFWVAIALCLAWFCFTQLKRLPNGLLEYAIWIGAVAIIVSWIR